MSFSNPEVFWALLLLLPAGAVLYYSYLKGKGELLKIGGAWRGYRIYAVYLLKSFFSGLLLLLTFLFLITAWAGPAWGTYPVEEPRDGLDIALCVDVSRSMTATDVLPSRLDQAREAIRALLTSFPNARFSLVGFEGEGVTLVPLTADHAVLEQWLTELNPQLTSAPGSNLESGVTEAIRTVDFSSSRHKALVVFSDGEGHEGTVVNAIHLATSRSIEVFTVGIGTAEGGRIPVEGGILKDDFGFPIQTKLQDAPLRQLAQETTGRYVAGAERSKLRELQDALSTLGNPSARGGVKLEVVPRYRVFLYLALVTLTGFLLVRIFPWKGIF